ncbi:MAG: N-acetylmuramoyl-L-alanine amidase, partial [Pseudomonadota bacterium]
VTTQTFYMDQPYRVIIDLSEVVFTLDVDEVFKPSGLIKNVRAGRISKGRSRIVITLTKPAEIIRASLQKVLDEDYFRLVVDLDESSSERFATLLNAQKLVLGESGNVASKGDRVSPVKKKDGSFTIVLDPGHGGIDGGAVGRLKTKEKDVVLDFAKELEMQLQGAGPFQVELTRREDVFMSLRQRLDFNRRMQADLFISIHADSLRDRRVRGSTIYTLSKKASDQLSERLAESENSVDQLAGLSSDTDKQAVTDILIDLTTRETKVFSRQFARILMTSLDDEIKLIKNPVRSAAFGVLKAPDVPGVLLELGYLSNAEDEKLLRADEWRKKAAKAVKQAIVGFFEPRVQ